MPLPIYVVDAFARERFSGNPAAVCLLDRPAPEGWVRQVAAEMNLSETAFLHPEGDGYRLRWFTPAVSRWTCAATPPWPAPTSCGRRDAARPAARCTFTRAAVSCRRHGTATGS